VRPPIVSYDLGKPSNVIDVASIAYAQSTVFTGYQAANNASMTNGSATETTRTLTGPFAIGGEWVRMDLGSVCAVANVVIGCDFTGTLGLDKTYTEGREVQYSDDATTWVTAFTIPVLTAAITTFPVSFSAQYIRVKAEPSNYIALTEFYATST
jgi:hypothetical protein